MYRPEFESAQQAVPGISLEAKNHGRVKELVKQRIASRKKWALVGGPPCQAYSLVGRSRMQHIPGFEQDERHFLYQEYLKLIADHLPPVIVMENVKGLLSAKIDGKRMIDRIVSDLTDPTAALRQRQRGPRYRLYSFTHGGQIEPGSDPRQFLVKSEKHGVPQARHRMFILGIRDDINVKPKTLQREDPPNVEQTIGQLPPIRSVLSRGGDSLPRWRKEASRLADSNMRSLLKGVECADAIASTLINVDDMQHSPTERVSNRYPAELNDGYGYKALKRMFDERLGALTGHESRGHMASDLSRYMFAAVFAKEVKRSPKLADFPKRLLPNHSNVDLGRHGVMFSDRFRVQMPRQVSTTVTSHISKDGHYFIHFDHLQCRALTVREAARLQTFPDNYHFEGPRTEQYHQVGNAVPPYLASQIARVVADVLDSFGSRS